MGGAFTAQMDGAVTVFGRYAQKILVLRGVAIELGTVLSYNDGEYLKCL